MKNNEVVRGKFATVCGHEQCERANRFGLEILDLAFDKYPEMSLLDFVTTLMDLGQIVTAEAVRNDLLPDTTLEASNLAGETELKH